MLNQDGDDGLMGWRRAALTLHGLGAPDRDWLLSQLEPHHRVSLRSLLAELADLGIPTEPKLVECALAAAEQGPADVDGVFGAQGPLAAWAAIEGASLTIQQRFFSALTLDERRQLLSAVGEAGPAWRLRAAAEVPAPAAALRGALRQTWRQAVEQGAVQRQTSSGLTS